MDSGKLDGIDRQIAELQRKRAELTSPKGQEIRDLYGQLDRILNRLAELGEDVTDANGYVITVAGTLFGYMHGDKLRER